MPPVHVDGMPFFDMANLLDFAEYPVLGEDINCREDIFDRMTNKLPVDVFSTGIRIAIIQNGGGVPLLCA